MTSRSASGYFEQALAESRALSERLGELGGAIDRVVAAMIRAWEGGGKILLAGNGGSATDAMHFAEELVARYKRNRRALPAIALTDAGILTCAANDFGYEQVFARQVEAYGRPGDVFVGFSTSGNSANVLRAFETARSQGLVTVGMLGKDGGAAMAMCDIPIVIPTPTTARVQESHMLIYHAICEAVDAWVLDG